MQCYVSIGQDADEAAVGGQARLVKLTSSRLLGGPRDKGQGIVRSFLRHDAQVYVAGPQLCYRSRRITSQTRVDLLVIDPL